MLDVLTASAVHYTSTAVSGALHNVRYAHDWACLVVESICLYVWFVPQATCVCMGLGGLGAPP
jgi:hypothetical protein